MAGIKDYSTTQANNTDLNGISTAEGMLPSNLNNAIRALMKNTREWFNDSQWVEYGDGSGTYTAAYASSTSFTIAGVDVTSFYHAGRRIKLIASTPGTIFGTISSSSFSTNTTVNVTWDSSSLSSEAITNVYVGALSKTNTSIPSEVIGATQLGDNAVTTSKIQGDAVNGTKIADDSINSEHYVDGSIDTAHIADSQITTAKITDANVTTAKIAADAVDGTKIADDSINSEHYVDGSIDTAHIADSQITTAKIADSQITSAKITDGAIVNADINASAAIDATKIHDGTISNTEFGYLNGVSSNIQTQLDAKGASNANLTAIGDLATTDGNFIVGSGSTWVAETGSTARTSLGLGTIATQASNSVSISGGSITGLGNPSNNSDAATKSYVDDAVAGLRTRIIAECGTTANVNLTNGLEAGDSIDGVTLVAGDRVLVKDQSDATENGLYLAVSSGAASRDPEHDTIAELSGGMVVVNQGTANDNKIFLCTTDSSASIGSSNITYSQITPANVGTVTSIATGTGIDGGTITSSGTISIDSTVATLTGTQTFTNKTLTTPKIDTSILDTNGNELAKLTATGSAVNEFTVANAATGGNPTLSSTGGDSNIDLDLLAKGTGHVTVKGNTNAGAIQLNCESNSHGQIIKSQPHSAAVTNEMLLPTGASSTLVSLVSTDTLTNKTLTSPKIGTKIDDTNGNELFNLTATGSAVNEFTIANAATGNAPEISATGGDTNIDLKLTPKGSGKLNLDGIKFPNADGSADQVLKTDGSGNLSFGEVSGGEQWQSVKTSTFTATAGEGYFVNTTSGVITMNLPAGTLGDFVSFIDYAGTFDSNTFTISANGSEKINGSTDDLTVSVERSANTLVYTDSTQGWLLKVK
jgi:hypothetical protein